MAVPDIVVDGKTISTPRIGAAGIRRRQPIAGVRVDPDPVRKPLVVDARRGDRLLNVISKSMTFSMICIIVLMIVRPPGVPTTATRTIAQPDSPGYFMCLPP